MHDSQDLARRIAERRIREAMERGEFEGLPGEGRPLRLDEDRGVPEELRMAFKIMKNAGCLPPEVELKKEIHSLRELLNSVDDGEGRARIRRQIDFRILKFNMLRRTPCHLDTHPFYGEKILSRLERGAAGKKA